MELAALGIFICYFAYSYSDSFSLLFSPRVLMNSYSLSIGWKINQQRRWKLTSEALGGIAFLKFSVDCQVSSSLCWRLALKKASGDGQCLASVSLRVNCPQGRLGVCLSGNCYHNPIYFTALAGPSCTQIFKSLEQLCIIPQGYTQWQFQLLSIGIQRNTEGICGITWEKNAYPIASTVHFSSIL